MMYLLVAYGERSSTLKLYEALRKRRIDCSVINTPREAAVGCGISVRFSERDYGKVLPVVNAVPRTKFLGVFKSVNGNVSRIF